MHSWRRTGHRTKKGAQSGGNEISVRRTGPFHFRSKFVTSRPVNRVPKERQHGDTAGGRGSAASGERFRLSAWSAHFVELVVLEFQGSLTS